VLCVCVLGRLVSRDLGVLLDSCSELELCPAIPTAAAGSWDASVRYKVASGIENITKLRGTPELSNN